MDVPPRKGVFDIAMSLSIGSRGCGQWRARGLINWIWVPKSMFYLVHFDALLMASPRTRWFLCAVDHSSWLCSRPRTWIEENGRPMFWRTAVNVENASSTSQVGGYSSAFNSGNSANGDHSPSSGCGGRDSSVTRPLATCSVFTSPPGPSK